VTVSPFDPDSVRDHLGRRLPGRPVTGAPERLDGGLLNHVFRVPVEGGSVVVKMAPAAARGAPEVELGPERIGFEAAALRWLAPDPLGAGDAVRAPQVVDLDSSCWTLIMEDVGPAPDLEQALGSVSDGDGRKAAEVTEVLGALGRFVGRLHAGTAGDRALSCAFRNRGVQRTRMATQYLAVETWAQAAGLPDAESLARAAREVGERFLEPGKCLVMGDLWPRSVLWSSSGVRLVDWEFVHFGHPAQDLGHWAAHLWMHAHAHPERAPLIRDGYRAFVEAYEAILGERPAVRDSDDDRAAAQHAGAEVLARVLGPFSRDYFYADQVEGRRQEALERARELLLGAEPPALLALV
jgi:Ser/Thr protein kinase RdoA (MazF antagonist)